MRYWLSIIQSVLAAFFGVQTDKKRQKDFSQTSPWPFLLIGLVLLAAFIFTIAVIVYWVTTY